MPHITSLYRGQSVHYWSKDFEDDTPLHAIIAHVDHANTENNNFPRVHLAVLLPTGQWTRRMSVPHADASDAEDGSKAGRWQEMT